jgi:hypothetical protein
MTKPIFKRNIITKEMITDFKIFNNIWLEYCDLLPIGCYEFDIFMKNIIKIRKDDFNFDVVTFDKLLIIMIETIHRDMNRGIIYNDDYDDYDGEILYGNEAIILCNKIKDHLRFISEYNLDYEKMKENNAGLFQELCESVFNPDRINKLANKFNIDLHVYLDSI